MIQSKLNNNIKVVILIVSAWIFVSILTSFDTKNQTRSPPPMYYYTSLKNDFINNRRKLAKTEVDTRLIEDIEQTENSDTDIFYDISHGKFRSRSCILLDIPPICFNDYNNNC